VHFGQRSKLSESELAAIENQNLWDLDLATPDRETWQFQAGKNVLRNVQHIPKKPSNYYF